jgi:aspartyl-tRNA(Asn)/glutamyl-tRNA(Gln) amidotransferase subunit A
MNIAELTIEEAQEGLQKRRFSSVELVKSCLERIKKLDSKIHAFITVCEKEALKQAKEADKLIKQLDNGSLLGIPIAVKDIFCTKGIRTTAGSKVLENYVPVYDSTVVKKLKESGAIIIGKTNLDAWAHGSSGENSDFFPTKNPWNLEYVPGGSSSGSAAAVAADMAIGAIGSDTAGSIRLPASFCNLVGLKPTYGRVSRYGVVAMASSLDTMGSLTKRVKDAAIILRVIAGKDFYDSTTVEKKVPDYLKSLKKGIKGLKIGVPKEYFVEGMNSKVREKIEEAIKVLKTLGGKIFEVSLPHTKYAIAAYYIIQPSEVSSNLARYDGIRYGFPRDKFGDEAKRRIMIGTFALSSGYYEAYYLKAMQVRTLIKKDFEEVFKKVEILVAPVSPTPPFKLGEKTSDPLKMYLSDILTATANLAGIPSLAIPCGFVDNLPVGFQILGPHFSEEILFRVGYHYEEETFWYKEKPKIL